MFSGNRALISEHYQTVLVAIRTQCRYYIYHHTLKKCPNSVHRSTKKSHSQTSPINFTSSIFTSYFTLPHILYLPLCPARHSTPFTSTHLAQLPPFKPYKPPLLLTRPITSPNIPVVPQHPNQNYTLTHLLKIFLALVFHLFFATNTVHRHRFHPNIVYNRQRRVE